jgi:HEAT repeat protein
MRSLRRTAPPILIAACAAGLAAAAACVGERVERPRSAAAASSAAPRGFDVGESRFCERCHPAIYAEHVQNTHGRAFHDGEARLATRGFRREDCVRCHTPRPLSETGIGRTPMTRWTDLDEGNTCMSCHAKAGYDYARFAGGAECKTAFDPRVGTVQDCATCHRIAGTPDQWSRAAHGSLAGNECLDCHMPLVVRPVAVGMPPRPVRSHVFPASRSESQLRRAYDYQASVEGGEVVVRVTNKGVGHNFPTANRQRAVESLVVVKDLEGKEVLRSRMVCHYPYASELEPHQLVLPVSSQIPSGRWREHRVPLPIGAGTVECRLYFKLYRPIADEDPTLSRCLEERRIAFDGVTPSSEPARETAEPGPQPPETDLGEFFSLGGLSNVVRPPPGRREVEIPAGSSPEDVRGLVALLESHLPEARLRAKDRLVEIGAPAYPAIVRALGHWSNETFTEAKRVLVRIGEPAVPALVAALDDEDLYVRCHAREVLARIAPSGSKDAIASEDAIRASLVRGTRAPNALDRRFSAEALAVFGDPKDPAALRALVDDPDPDVVAAAARSLSRLGDRDSIPAVERALARARFPETRRDLAVALAGLGSAAGIPALLEQLSDADPLMRELAFESFFAATGVHLGYEADAPEGERLEAIARLQGWWAASGGQPPVRAPRREDPSMHERAWDLVEQLGGGTDTRPGGDDKRILEELVAIGDGAVSALVEGLTFPPGFAQKRALVCRALGEIGDQEAAPFLAAALRDPVPEVAEWACLALEKVRDEAVLPQVRAFQRRVPALVGSTTEPGDESPADRLVARAARTRLVLGDERAVDDLVNMLLSPSLPARRIAIQTLAEREGDDRGYEPDGSPESRRAAAARWRTPAK